MITHMICETCSHEWDAPLHDPGMCGLCYDVAENAWQYMMLLHRICSFSSVEKPGQQATNSELKRWIQNKAVIINGVAVGVNDKVEEVTSLVLFPKGARKTTLV